VGVHVQPSNGLVSVILFDAASQLRAHFSRRLGITGDGNLAEIYPLVTVLLIAAAMVVVRMIV
jgi:hypothetical protein